MAFVKNCKFRIFFFFRNKRKEKVFNHVIFGKTTIVDGKIFNFPNGLAHGFCQKIIPKCFFLSISGVEKVFGDVLNSEQTIANNQNVNLLQRG